MDNNILWYVGGIFTTYVLFVLDELYNYLRKRRRQKVVDEEDEV